MKWNWWWNFICVFTISLIFKGEGHSRKLTFNFIGGSVCFSVQQEAISQKEIVFRFRKDIQSLRKAGILIFCAWQVSGCVEICPHALLCAHWSAQFPKPRYFEMYLLVILLFLYALLEGDTPLYQPYRYVQPQRVWEIWCRFCRVIFVSKWVCFFSL